MAKKDIILGFPGGDRRMEAAAKVLREAGWTVRPVAAPEVTHPLPRPGASKEKLDVWQDPELLAKNAAVTAEGAIFLAMGRMEITIEGCQALVLGFGRIGKLLAKKLQALGAHVTVQARKPADRALAQALGYESQDLGTAGNWDVVFNTIPAPVFPQTAAPAGCVLIELASSPGFIPQEGTLNGRGLPGTYAPETAGALLAQAVMRKLQEEL